MVDDRGQKGHGFEVRGINHLALVCRDMAATVAFYEGILGMPLTKTIELGGGAGQHFFFDCGNGNSVAFFWFPDAPPAAPGVSMPADRPDRGAIHSAHGSMNHVEGHVVHRAVGRVDGPPVRPVGRHRHPRGGRWCVREPEEGH